MLINNAFVKIRLPYRKNKGIYIPMKHKYGDRQSFFSYLKTFRLVSVGIKLTENQKDRQQHFLRTYSIKIKDQVIYDVRGRMFDQR